MAENRETIKLESLSVGARIAFIRKIRGMTQRELGNAIGLEGAAARNIICRYERTSRIPRSDILQAIAAALDTDVELIKKYDFKDPLDMYFIMLWVEEICPNYVFNKIESEMPRNNTQKILMEKYTDWHRVRLKYQKGAISHKAYIEWKLSGSEKHESCV